MRTPSLSEFKTWARAHSTAAIVVCAAQAFAKVERERVDAYIRPIFNRYAFQKSLPVGKDGWRMSGPVNKPDDLYLCTDEPRIAAYYAECDAAHRAHGFTGPDGHCPALVAAEIARKCENGLITEGAKLMGIELPLLYGERRQKMLDLLLGACLKTDERKAA